MKDKSFSLLPKSFLVKIIHNKNNSWQGKISCANWSRDKSFSSALELLHLMESEINSKSEPGD